MSGVGAALAADYRRLLTGDHGTVVTFYGSHGEQRDAGYPEIAAAALRVAGGLRDLGARRGDRLAVAVHTCPDLLPLLLGCLYAGVAPCVLPLPPSGTGDPSRPATQALLAAIDLLDPVATVLPERFDAPPGRVRHLRPAELTGSTPLGLDDLLEAGDDDVHHIQLTSGSTARPRAAVLTFGNVATTIGTFRDNIGFDLTRDGTLNWLPLYHDMGLVQVMFSLAMGGRLGLMTPTGFLRDPLRWLHNLATAGATLAAAPPFALRACVSRFTPDRAAGLDLTRWRRLFVGAEPVSEQLLAEFADTFGPYGLRRSTLYPCYGMAETVLPTTLMPRPVCGGPWDGGWVKPQLVDADALRTRDRAVPDDGSGSTRVLAMGAPVDGVELCIKDETGLDLGDRCVGEICVRGAAVMAGYLGTDPADTFDADGWFHTGDSGYRDDGLVYVIARLKETLIVRGRNIAPHVIEDILESHPAVGPGHALVFAVPVAADGLDGVVALIEIRGRTMDPATATDLASLVRAGLGLNLHDIRSVPRGWLPRTTSGKKQRLLARSRYTACAPADAIPEAVGGG